jgi:hypothetical protein
MTHNNLSTSALKSKFGLTTNALSLLLQISQKAIGATVQLLTDTEFLSQCYVIDIYNNIVLKRRLIKAFKSLL